MGRISIRLKKLPLIGFLMASVEAEVFKNLVSASERGASDIASSYRHSLIEPNPFFHPVITHRSDMTRVEIFTSNGAIKAENSTLTVDELLKLVELYGAKPHKIMPRRRDKKLAWLPRNSFVGRDLGSRNKKVFAPFVNHPGMRAKNRLYRRTRNADRFIRGALRQIRNWGP